MKVIAATMAAVGALAGGTVKVTLSAPGHAPKINVKWYYVLRVTKDGKPATAKVTAQIVDPIGGVHPVEFGPSTKKIINYRFTGTFRDYIIWPPESREVPLKLRFIVVVGAVKKVVTYAVTPHS